MVWVRWAQVGRRDLRTRTTQGGPEGHQACQLPPENEAEAQGVFILSLLGPREAVLVPCNPSFFGRASGALSTSGGRGVCEGGGGWRSLGMDVLVSWTGTGWPQQGTLRQSC